MDGSMVGRDNRLAARSEKELLSIIENGHYAADQVYSYKSNSKNSANLDACAAKFSLSKNHRDLKNKKFLKNWQIACFYFKEKLPKINFKLKFEFHYFSFSKWAERFLFSIKVKQFFFKF